MFKIKAIILLSTMVTGITMATENSLPEIKTKAIFGDKRIQYTATFAVDYMYCDIRINNMSAASSEQYPLGVVSGSFDFLESVVNGSNEISIEAADLFFIDPNRYFPQKFKDNKLEEKYGNKRKEYAEYIKILSEEGRETHINDGYCSLLIEANILGDENAERRPIAFLKIVRNKDEGFEISEESYGFLAGTDISPNSTIKGEVIARNEGVIEDVFKVSREINIKNIPYWSWSDSPKFDDIPNNLELLKQGYQEFWEILNSHDEAQIKEYLALSLDEMSMAKGYRDRDDSEVKELWLRFYNRLGYGTLVENGYEMQLLDFTDYEVKQSASGHLVRLVKKGLKRTSPISYIRTDSTKTSNQHHYFAYVNGKFILVR